MATPSVDPASKESTETETEMTQPIIVDLGRQRASKLRDLKEGEGELWDEVLDVLDEVKEMLADEANGKVMVPVVMIYEKKLQTRWEQMLFPLADWSARANATDDDDDEEDEAEA